MEEKPTQNPITEPVLPTTPSIPEQKSTLPKWIIMAIVAIILIGIIGFVLALFLATTDPLHRFQKSPTNIAIQSPTPTSTPDPTANWPIYVNSKIGFQIKYPQRYPKPALPSGTGDSPTIYATGNEDNADIIFGTTSQDSYSIFVFPFSGTLDELMISQQATSTRPYNGLPLSQFTTTTKEVMVGGVKARWLISSYKEGSLTSEKHNNIFFTKNNHGFIINTWPDYNLTELNQILSTFKFTDQASQALTTPTPISDETASWIFYKNVDYPFQIKYPKDWTLRTTYGTSVKNTGNSRVAGIDLNTGAPGYGSVLVVNVIDPQGKNLEDWLRSNISNTLIPTKITYMGLPAYHYTYSTQPIRLDTVEIYFQYKDKIVFLAWNLTSGVDQPTADQIMSTLKFTQ